MIQSNSGSCNKRCAFGVKRKYDDNGFFQKESAEKLCQKCIANRLSLKYAGPYVLGPFLENGPVKCISQFLARKMATDKFFSLKLLTLISSQTSDKDEKNGKILLHTEFTILSLLHEQEGVIHVHGFFQEDVSNPQNKKRFKVTLPNRNDKNIKSSKRLCLVLDCVTPHDYGPDTQSMVNLQQYIVKQKQLSEKEAVLIFFDVVRVVKDLHEKNIIHRDLKLGNIILDKSTKRITLTNFCLGKHLVRGNELLHDQRGSPAYISPEVLSGEPYCGKAADNWALGVMLYTLLYAQFPFFDSSPRELFQKIKNAEYTIPKGNSISEETVLLVQGLLHPDVTQRSTASEICKYLQETVTSWYCSKLFMKDNQIVPFSPTQEKLSKNDEHDKKMTSTFIAIPSPRVAMEKENFITRTNGCLTPLNQVNRSPLHTTPANLYHSPQTIRNRAGNIVRPLRDRETGQHLQNRFRTMCPPVSPV